MKERIIGIDVARALAVIGMIIVNFKIAFGNTGNTILKSFVQLFEGKAAATFVFLAGVGIAFMSNSTIREKDTVRLRRTKIRILKRAVFLFIVGLLYIPIWEADILHFYGIYMLIVLFVINSSRTIILGTALFFILIYPFLLFLWNYDVHWDFSTFEYHNFWTPEGFITNLFFNGFHPVIPWCSFMLIGLWYGKQNLNDSKFLVKSTWMGLLAFLLVQVVSKVSIFILSDGNPVADAEIEQVLGTSPMPPLPLYMLTGSSFAIFATSICVLVAKKYKNLKVVELLKKTGQLALTFYVAHVVIGMIAVYLFDPSKMGSYSISFSLGYALVFSALCILFAHFWNKKHKMGPLEWAMRKITG